MLAITNFPKFNENSCTKNTLLQQSEAMYNFIKMYVFIFTLKSWLKETFDKFIKVLKVEKLLATLTLNFSSCVILDVTLKNIKTIFIGHGRMDFCKINLFLIITNKIKFIAQKMSKSKYFHSYADINKNLLTWCFHHKWFDL